jgi:hypothetical protein
MFRFRLLILSTISWLAFVLNLEAILRNLEIAIHIQPFVYILAIVTVISMISVLKLHEVQTVVSVSTLALLYGIGKVLFLIDLNITSIIIEVTLVIGTFFVARPVASWLGNYSKRIKSAVFSPTNTLMLDKQHNAAAIERKISLARRFGRELSLLYIPMSRKFRTSDDMRAMVLQRKLNELVNLLVDDSGLYAWHNGDLMVCLQGEAVRHLDTIAAQFSSLITDVLKMQIQIGVADFPAQGLMLDDLIESAHTTLGQPIIARKSADVVVLRPQTVRIVQTAVSA